MNKWYTLVSAAIHRGISAEVCIVPKVAAEEYGASLGRNGRWEDEGFGTSQINRSRV